MSQSDADSEVPEFQEQMHFMSCQADMLDEEGNDVSASVMRDAIKVLVAERKRVRELEGALYAANLKALRSEKPAIPEGYVQGLKAALDIAERYLPTNDAIRFLRNDLKDAVLAASGRDVGDSEEKQR